MSSSTSSNLWGNTNIQDITNSGARLIMSHDISGFSGGIMTHPLGGTYAGDGVTAGDVIRYDTVPDSVSYKKYTKAMGNVAENAEVVGVIETIENGVVGVVISGQIKFPSGRFATADHIATPTIGGASGGNDVYFLSAATAGGVQSLAPNKSGQIAKPVLQVADDGVFNAHVVNYIGYQIGGNIAGSTETYNMTGSVDRIIDFDDNRNIDGSNSWFRVDRKTWLPLNTSAPEYIDRLYTNASSTVFGNGRFGRRDEIIISQTPPTSLVGRRLIQKDGRITIWSGIVSGVNRTTNTINVESVELDSSNKAIAPDVSKTLYDGTIIYTPTTVTPMAFALPVYSVVASSQFKDIYGKSSTHSDIYVMFVLGDDMGRVITIPNQVEIEDAVITNKLTITNADATSTTTDVAEVLRLINADLNSLASKTNTTLNVKNIT